MMVVPFVAFSSTKKTTHNSHMFSLTLSSTNYRYWKAMLQLFFITNNLLIYVDGAITRPLSLIASSEKKGEATTSKPNPTHAIWISNDAHTHILLMSIILEASVTFEI